MVDIHTITTHGIVTNKVHLRAIYIQYEVRMTIPMCRLGIAEIPPSKIPPCLIASSAGKERVSFNKYYLSKDISLIQNILKTNGYYFSTVETGLIKNEDLN